MDKRSKIVLSKIIGKKLAEDVKFFVDKLEGTIVEGREGVLKVKFRINQDETYNNICEVTSEDFKNWLRLNCLRKKIGQFDENYEKLISILRLDYSIENADVCKRLAKAKDNNDIFIDLCNQSRSVIKISDACDMLKISIIKESEVDAPIIFRRTMDMQEIPEPKSKDLKGLLGSLLYLDDQELWNVLCWLTVTFDSNRVLSLLSKKIEFLRTQRQ